MRNFCIIFYAKEEEPFIGVTQIQKPTEKIKKNSNSLKLKKICMTLNTIKGA